MVFIKNKLSLKKCSFLFTVLLLLLSPGCVKELEWEQTDDTPSLLVVEGLVTSREQNQYVKLTRSREVIVEGQAATISGAIITVSDGEQIHKYYEEESGIYVSEKAWAGQVGKNYYLTIELEGEIYEAKDSMVEATIPPDVSIRESELAQGFYWVEYPGNFGGESPARLNIQIVAPDDWAETFPYEITEYWEDKQNGYSNGDSSYYIHPYVEPPAVLAYGILEVGIFPLGSEIHLEHGSLSPEHYDFVRAFMAETEWKGLGPFGYNPANIPTNLTNGAIGFFGASHLKSKVQVISE